MSWWLVALTERMNPSGKPVVALVAGEGLERTVGEDAAEVEEHGLDAVGARSPGALTAATARATPSQSSADSAERVDVDPLVDAVEHGGVVLEATVAR